LSNSAKISRQDLKMDKQIAYQHIENKPCCRMEE
jgi:hypothetical protein